MRLAVYDDADAWLGDAGIELERREAEHSLILGIAAGIRTRAPSEPPFLAAVRRGGELALAAVMTPPNPLILAGDGGDALRLLVRALRDTGPTPTAVVGPVRLAERFVALWSDTGDGTARIAQRQRIHALTAVQSVPTPPGALRPATEADTERVARWMAAFEAEALGEAHPVRATGGAARRIAASEIYLWDDGEPRAMAGRTRPTRRSISVNAVYTPPEQRRRGYATALVAALSQRLLDEGRRSCVLFTDLANATSNAIYARIGYRPLSDFTLWRLDTGITPSAPPEGSARSTP